MLYRPLERMHRDITFAPLVLLPGTLCDGAVFGPMMERMGVGGTVVPLRGVNSTGAMADAILAEAPPKMSLVGFSLGAIVALELMARAPERVERLALIGCNPGVLDAEARLSRAAMTRDDFIAALVPAFARPMAETVSDADWTAQTAMTLSRTDSTPRLSQIAVPTLVVCGADDDICPPQMSETIAAHVPGARLARIDGAGHYVTLQQPDRVAREILAWLSTPPFASRKEQQ